MHTSLHTYRKINTTVREQLRTTNKKKRILETEPFGFFFDNQYKLLRNDE